MGYKPFRPKIKTAYIFPKRILNEESVAYLYKQNLHLFSSGRIAVAKEGKI